MRHALFFAASAALLSAGAGRAQDCRTPDEVLAGIVIPADGTSGVPTNVTPFVGTGGALELLLVGDDGNEVPAQIEAIAVGEPGGIGVGAAGTIKRIVPAGDLNPGENITVVADGAAVTHFTVGTGRDDQAPLAPDASVGESCNSQAAASITVGVATDDAVLFVGVVDGQPTLGAGARFDGASSGSGQLVVFGSGSADVNVAGVDLAGNVGASTPVKVQFPDLPALCACTSSSSGPGALGAAAGVVLGAVFLRPRRRAP